MSMHLGAHHTIWHICIDEYIEQASLSTAAPVIRIVRWPLMLVDAFHDLFPWKDAIHSPRFGDGFFLALKTTKPCPRIHLDPRIGFGMDFTFKRAEKPSLTFTRIQKNLTLECGEKTYPQIHLHQGITFCVWICATPPELRSILRCFSEHLTHPHVPRKPFQMMQTGMAPLNVLPRF